MKSINPYLKRLNKKGYYLNEVYQHSKNSFRANFRTDVPNQLTPYGWGHDVEDCIQQAISKLDDFEKNKTQTPKPRKRLK